MNFWEGEEGTEWLRGILYTAEWAISIGSIYRDPVLPIRVLLSPDYVYKETI
jgi:hypothetical protein